MHKILLIIKREYLSRVRKRSFIVMTILGPLLFAGIFIVLLAADRLLDFGVKGLHTDFELQCPGRKHG